jgi:precorrin-6A synthase
MRRIRVIGIGSGGLDQLTVEAVRAMNEVDFFVVTDKAVSRFGKDGSPDPLVAARGELLARHVDNEPQVVVVTDPERDRQPADYEAAVSDWHEARAEAWEKALLEHDGDAGFLVWGEPAFYDSTIRVIERVLERGTVQAELDVLPGISSLQVLAARHRLVLHDVGQPVHVTTGRRLLEAVDGGQDNIVVMLNRSLEPLESLGDWQIWWGANLGTPSERLVSGRVRDVLPAIEAARDEVKRAAGWVMDVYLLRRA